MSQGDKDRNDQISGQKGHKGQICNGTISKNLSHGEYYFCGECHAFMEKCTILALCRYTIYQQIY